jgi:hypothetical protein
MLMKSRRRAEDLMKFWRDALVAALSECVL